jgi:hypothetical protein
MENILRVLSLKAAAMQESGLVRSNCFHDERDAELKLPKAVFIFGKL